MSDLESKERRSGVNQPYKIKSLTQSPMKTLTKTLVTLITFTLVPLALNAADEQKKSPEYQLPSFKVEDMSLPIPTKIVEPRLRSNLFGKEVKMFFTVTEKGQAVHIRSSRNFSNNPELALALTKVIQKWEFEPARDKNGIARKVKVSLPVRVVKKDSPEGIAASLTLAKPTVISLAK